MRYIEELHYIASHTEWWRYDDDCKYFIPTSEAPPEAVEAIKRLAMSQQTVDK